MLVHRSILTGVVAVLFGVASVFSTNTAQADEYIGGWQKDYPVVSYGVISRVVRVGSTVRLRLNWLARC